ncbi:MAG: HAD family phosphatase [Candidatus Acidiferrales bacterium]
MGSAVRNGTDNRQGIHAVILDFGEVLCRTPSPENIKKIADIFKLDPQTFLPNYLQGRGPYDRGDVQPSEYWTAFAEDAGMEIDDPTIEQLRRLDLDLWSRIDDEMIAWLEQIHSAGFKTAILSNMPTDMATHVRRTYPWIDYFDHHIFSGEVRSVKPEPEIYEHCIAALKVQPPEALFIDDRDENLEQARAVGIRTIRYQSVPQLRAELQTLGFPVLPRGPR